MTRAQYHFSKVLFVIKTLCVSTDTNMFVVVLAPISRKKDERIDKLVFNDIFTLFVF